jgi:GNAT superfamily N-acetyltransferase
MAGAGDPSARVVIVGSPLRTEPGWDGTVHAVTGVGDPQGRVLVSVPPDVAADARDLVAAGGGLDALAAALPGLLGRPDDQVYRATCRWTTEPAGAGDLPDAGRWLPADDPQVPQWLRPFGGEVLVAADEHGGYRAGVGLKRHDGHAHEIAVGTEEAARGRGLARRLVAQAARHLLAAGIVPTYLHDPSNVASARVARAAGFPDRGWTAMGLADASEQAAAAG